MLIWINGPFGGGKTQTAHEIVRRLPGSVLCDPEYVGFGLHRMTPPPRGDFQDLRAWRAGVVEVLDGVLARDLPAVVVPMTVIEPAYFAETVGRLRAGGHDVRHFALLARRETVERRLRERGLGHAFAAVTAGRVAERRESFALQKLDLCLRRLQQPEFAEQIWTDVTPVPRVADHIAASCGLALTPNTDSTVRNRLRQSWIGLRHIRLG